MTKHELVKVECTKCHRQWNAGKYYLINSWWKKCSKCSEETGERVLEPAVRSAQGTVLGTAEEYIFIRKKGTELERMATILKELGVPCTFAAPFQSHQSGAIRIGRQFFHFNDDGKFSSTFTVEAGIIKEVSFKVGT